MLAQTRENPAADFIAMIVVFLMAIGTVFVFSASASISYELDLQRFYDYPGLRQILFFPLACTIMFAFSYLNYRKFSLSEGWLRTPMTFMLILSIVLLIIVLSQRFSPYFRDWYLRLIIIIAGCESRLDQFQ